MDNLAGDVEKLGGAFDTALIQTGSGANDVLRGLVQTATFLVDGFGELPEPVLNVALALGVSTTAVLLLGGAVLRAAPGIAQLRMNLAAAGTSFGSLAGKVGLATAGLTVATLVVGYFVAESARAAANTDEFRESLDETTGSLTGYTRELVAKKLADSGAFEAAKEAGISQRELTDAVIEGGEALDSVYSKLNANNTVATFFTGVGIRAGNARTEIRSLSSSLEQSKRDWEDMTAAGDDSIPTLNDIAGAADDARGEIAGLSDELRNFGTLTYDVIDAELQFRQAIEEASSSVGEDGFSRTLDRATEAGRDNWNALLDMGRATNEYAAAAYDAHGSQDELNGILAEGWQRLYDQAIQFGATEDEAKSYADQLIATPTVISTRVGLDVSPALGELARLRESLSGNLSALNSLNNWRPSNFRYNAAGAMYLSGAPVQAFAAGGFPSGIYPYRQGGIHKFAEAGPEAYISFREQDRQRNVGIWREAGAMLGVWGMTQSQQNAQPSVQDNRSYAISVPPSPDPTYQANEIVRALRWS